MACYSCDWRYPAVSDFDVRAKSAPASADSLLHPLTSDIFSGYHPTPEGHPPEDDLDVFGSVNAGAELFRRNPEYKTYYQANRALNPRLPPPLPSIPQRTGFEVDAGLGIAGGSVVDRIQADFPRTASPAISQANVRALCMRDG